MQISKKLETAALALNLRLSYLHEDAINNPEWSGVELNSEELGELLDLINEITDELGVAK
jgi:division protein CdvB (Snf7/Vps24/ESCRT-III family)